MATRANSAYWPDVSTIESAKSAARQGMWAAIVVAGFTVFLVVLAMAGTEGIAGTFDETALIDAAAFALIAFGIYRFSRTAAVLGLVIFVVERIYLWSVIGVKGPILAIIITLAFVTSVRGTFAYHKLKMIEAAPAPVTGPGTVG
jgi:hypothetical protein